MKQWSAKALSCLPDNLTTNEENAASFLLWFISQYPNRLQHIEEISFSIVNEFHANKGTWETLAVPLFVSMSSPSTPELGFNWLQGLQPGETTADHLFTGVGSMKTNDLNIVQDLFGHNLQKQLISLKASHGHNDNDFNPCHGYVSICDSHSFPNFVITDNADQTVHINHVNDSIHFRGQKKKQLEDKAEKAEKQKMQQINPIIQTKCTNHLMTWKKNKPKKKIHKTPNAELSLLSANNIPMTRSKRLRLRRGTSAGQQYVNENQAEIAYFGCPHCDKKYTSKGALREH
ncbi:hypothetical protein RFI_15335, partial [Reticulomyxa filosa]